MKAFNKKRKPKHHTKPRYHLEMDGVVYCCNKNMFSKYKSKKWVLGFNGISYINVKKIRFGLLAIGGSIDV